MLDYARRSEVGRRVDDTADDPRRIDGARDHAPRIDSFQVETFEVATVSLEIPPGNTVQSTYDGRVWRQGAGQLARNRRETVRLERHDHHVAAADRAAVIRCVRTDREFLAGCDHAKPLRLDGAQVWATRQKHDILAGTRK